MKFLVLMLLVLFGAALVTSVAMNEAGYVLLALGQTSIELPLLDFVVMLVAVMLMLFILTRLLTTIFQTPRKLGEKRRHAKTVQSRKGLVRGLIEMAGGDWTQAEKSVLKNIKSAESPLLNYLLAAHAAQQQNNTTGRDEYLRKAIAADPHAEVAVGLTQVELQLRQKQYEEALATLQHLEHMAPRHKLVKKQKGRLLFRLKDWQQLAELLPTLRKMNALGAEELQQMEQVTAKARLQQLGASGELDALKKLWNELPVGQKSHADVAGLYAAQLKKLGEAAEAELILTATLDKTLDDALLRQLSEMRVKDPTVMLAKMESWAQKHPDHSVLLMAMGRICLQDKLWGKARSLLNQSLARKPSAEAYAAMANLCEQTDATEEALVAYKAGLNLSLKQPV